MVFDFFLELTQSSKRYVEKFIIIRPKIKLQENVGFVFTSF